MHSKYYLLIALLVTTLCNLTAQTAQQPLDKETAARAAVYSNPPAFSLFVNSTLDNSTHATIVSEAEYVELNMDAINDIMMHHYNFIEVSIPFENENIIVQLFPSELFTSDFELRTSNNEAVPYANSAHYRGVIKGEQNTLVAMSFFSTNVQAIIARPTEGNIVIAGLKNAITHVIYRDKNLLIPNLLNCATPDTEMEITVSPEPMDGAMIEPCVRVFIEADYEMFLDEGGAVQTADQIVGFFNVSSTIYFNEGITAIISEIFVWTADDPYPTTSSFDALEAFRDFRTSFDGDIAHLITYDDENLGGVAWLPALCSDYNYAYSNIYNFYYDFPTYSWTVDVFTHEMGHNLGSPHTHNCSWPGGAIDDCYTTEGGCDPGPTPFDGGTIMSYCHLTGYGKNFSFGFGDLPGALIFDEVNDAGCLGACELPPANDWPCSAINIPVNYNCVLMDATNVGAINSVIPIVGCDGFSNGDVWFKVIIPAEGYVIIDTDNGAIVQDMGMKVYTGSCTDFGGYPAGCVADGSTYAPLMPGFTITAAPGSEFLLLLWEVNDDAFGTFSICAYTNCAPSIAAESITASETTICPGESTILNIVGGGLGTASEWYWYANDCESTAIGTGASITVSPSENTTYYVKAIGECDTTICTSKTIFVSPSPATPIITNTNCLLSTEYIVGATYVWFVDGIEITGATNDTLIITEGGNYSVQITTATGCSITSAIVSGDCQEVGISSLPTPEINIYPNPTNGKFTVTTANYSGELICKIQSLTGQTIYQSTYTISNNNRAIEINLNVAAGFYLVTFENKSATFEKVLIIE